MIWRFAQGALSLDSVRIMGVLNVTPDSFSDGGNWVDADAAVAHAVDLVRAGADILDVGGESTRPGAKPVSDEEELRRILPVVKAIRCKMRVPISVDTTKPEVARACLEAGADIINDVSGLRLSGPAMTKLAAEYRAGLILMHSRGTPETMKALAQYQDVTAEVLAELEESAVSAMNAGVERERIMMDPGLGFAKNAEQNFRLLAEIDRFAETGFPVLVGASRKSFLGEATGRRDPEERDFATSAVTAYCATKQVHMIRVHHAGAARDVLHVINNIKKGSGAQDHVRT